LQEPTIQRSLLALDLCVVPGMARALTRSELGMAAAREPAGPQRKQETRDTRMHGAPYLRYSANRHTRT